MVTEQQALEYVTDAAYKYWLASAIRDTAKHLEQAVAGGDEALQENLKQRIDELKAELRNSK